MSGTLFSPPTPNEGSTTTTLCFLTDGELLWEKKSECHEKGGYLSVSPNGKHFGYADAQGPHIHDRQGNGAFVYSIDNRMYYNRLQN